MCELKCQSRRRRSRLGTMQRQRCMQGDRQRRSKQRRRQGGGRRRKPKLRSRQGGRQTSRRGENPKPRKRRRHWKLKEVCSRGKLRRGEQRAKQTSTLGCGSASPSSSCAADCSSSGLHS